MAAAEETSSDGPKPDEYAERKPAFTVVCLGVGGGPLETNCSCYLMKPTDATWEESTFMVEGGSFLGTLASLLRDAGKPDSPFYDVSCDENDDEDVRAGKFNALIRSALISHGHLDHIFGLVLASAAQRGQRPIYGTDDTLQTIRGMFNGRHWPPLASFDATDPLALYHLRRLFCKQTEIIAPNVQVTPFSVSHGKSLIPPEEGSEKAEAVPGDSNKLFGKDVVDMPSTAFLLTNTRLERDVLFFGDVESDETGNTMTNHNVWLSVAHLFVKKRLSTIFIECSYTDAQPRDMLFGHFCPKLLYQDLRDFARCVVAYRKTGNAESTDVTDEECIGALSGLRCVIIHVKGLVIDCTKFLNRNHNLCTSYEGAPLFTQAIAAQISDHEAEGRLGVRFHIAKRGERLEC
ncbi:3',5'-cyclic-nucleotide phosphodiesterase [Malassezia cuniculi]|uniref:3',5'-cyclic-nucleotide phosphodiesterase n=1 Tax=Malassezia cuniculi TaxID=948313 RepID=A0AAF0EQG4_9BASI|nr:3',5'-cyclic-nucleotide phosphodiesterase [Malassezia cuniculi]